MFRKLTLALAAASVICLGAISATPASAGWHGGGHHHNHWRGGWRGPAFYGVTTYPAYTGCYRPVRVITPWGPRWRRVWVCG